MKKKKINKLNLQKRAVSKLDNLSGGLAVGPIAVGTNVWSNCEVCNTVRNTQCKGDKCPNFTTPCNAVSAPVNAGI